jgi:hypothetical protein
MTVYVKNNTLFHISEVRALHPSTSLPDGGDATSLGYEKLITSAPPAPLPWHVVDQGAPVNNVQTWVQIPLSTQEIIDSVSKQVQDRLNDFAQTGSYDSILSATTYATSAVSKFKTEGQYCVQQRDATWAKLYEIMEAVQSGARPMPSSYADIEAELPVLVWP